MENKFVGWTLIILSMGLIICLLASIGFNTYFSYSDKDKKIEVRAENSNSQR